MAEPLENDVLLNKKVALVAIYFPKDLLSLG